MEISAALGRAWRPSGSLPEHSCQVTSSHFRLPSPESRPESTTLTANHQLHSMLPCEVVQPAKKAPHCSCYPETQNTKTPWFHASFHWLFCIHWYCSHHNRWPQGSNEPSTRSNVLSVGPPHLPPSRSSQGESMMFTSYHHICCSIHLSQHAHSPSTTDSASGVDGFFDPKKNSSRLTKEPPCCV